HSDGTRPGATHRRKFARTITAARSIATLAIGKKRPFLAVSCECGLRAQGDPAKSSREFSAKHAMAKSKKRARNGKDKNSPPAPDVLERIAAALDRLAPRQAAPPAFSAADAYVWYPDGRRLAPVSRVNRVEMSLLKGIDRVRDVLMENTERFAKGLPA